MSNPIAFGPPPVASGTPGAANPIAFQQNAQRILQGGGMGGGGFQPPAPTLPPINPGGMQNPMAMGGRINQPAPYNGPMPGGAGMPPQGVAVQPPAMQNPMVRPNVVQGFQGGRQQAQPMSPRNTLL
jgi:hypothetical protein